MSINERTEEQNLVCVCVCVCVRARAHGRPCVYKIEYHLALKRNESLISVTTWMIPEDVMLSEISQTGKNKYRRIAFRGLSWKSQIHSDRN